MSHSECVTYYVTTPGPEVGLNDHPIPCYGEFNWRSITRHSRSRRQCASRLSDKTTWIQTNRSMKRFHHHTFSKTCPFSPANIFFKFPAQLPQSPHDLLLSIRTESISVYRLQPSLSSFVGKKERSDAATQERDVGFGEMRTALRFNSSWQDCVSEHGEAKERLQHSTVRREAACQWIGTKIPMMLSRQASVVEKQCLSARAIMVDADLGPLHVRYCVGVAVVARSRLIKNLTLSQIYHRIRACSYRHYRPLWRRAT